MVTLDKVMEMQKQGLSDADISTQLQNEGIAATEINDSLNQAKIKNAVSPPEGTPQAQMPGQEMQASIMQNPPAGQPPAGQIPAQPMAQEIGEQPPTQQPPTQQPPAPAFPAPEIYPPQGSPEQPQDNYYTQTPQAYGQNYYAPQSGVDTETISEIAEQVVTEKLNEFKKKTGDLVSFRNTIEDKVNDVDDRLKRIEATIDKLQQAIIGKIGEFGESNAAIHKDLDNLHGTVSNLMNPLIDNINELKKISK